MSREPQARTWVTTIGCPPAGSGVLQSLRKPMPAPEPLPDPGPEPEAEP